MKIRAFCMLSISLSCESGKGKRINAIGLKKKLFNSKKRSDVQAREKEACAEKMRDHFFPTIF